MMPKSIRWRLPLSYMAIAVVAAMALGAVLLTTLGGYYRQREIDYLQSNARAISANLSLLLEADAPPEALRSQVSTFAFLSQARVRLTDLEGEVIADSGDPQQLNDVVAISVGLEAGGVSQAYTQQVDAAGQQREFTSVITVGGDESESGSGSLVVKESVVVKGDVPSGLAGQLGIDEATAAGPSLTSRIPAIGTQFGFGLGPESFASNRRSSRTVRWPVHTEFNQLTAYVELSDGPAVGSAILRSVAWGWAFSSGVAVLLAAAIGWFMSRGLTAPLRALTVVTARMAEGDLSARVGSARRDELGQLARSFDEMADRVETTVVTLRRFVADAAHQIHTPLTALRTDLELLSRPEQGEERRDLLARAQAQVKSIETLSTGLLELSRLETGAADELHAPLSLAELARQVAEPYASQAEQAQVSFNSDLGNEDVTIVGSAPQLRLALGNILDNAVKFTPSGGEVTVGLRKDGGWAVLSVEDTGIGIPADDLPYLMARFHRGRNTAEYPGSGLGLAIAKATVEGHGGEVTAENTPRGARFCLRLPLEC